MSADHKSHRKEYFIIFAILTILTIVEVGITMIGLSKGMKATGLVILAVAKASTVALYYMHLKSETKILKWIVAFPGVMVAGYAVALMLEVGTRYTP